MPFPISLRIKIRSSVVRCGRVAVKINRDEVRILEIQGGHRPPAYDHQSNDCYRSANESQASSNRAPKGEFGGTPDIAHDGWRKQSHQAERKGGPVLGGGEQRKGVEYSRHGRKKIVEERSPEGCGHRRLRPHDIYQR